MRVFHSQAKFVILSERKGMNIQMDKKLYMGTPYIHYNQIDANILSIIASERNAEQWMYNNFIQIVAIPNAHWSAFMFENDTLQDCPFLNNNHYERTDIQINIIKFLEYNIEQEKYIWLNVKKKHLSVYKGNLEKNHDIFVYGYNDEKQILYVADFFERGIYSRKEVSYKGFLDGYNNVIQEYDSLGVYTIWVKKNCRYEVEGGNIIKHGIINYLNGEYPFNKYKFMREKCWGKYKYGIKIYDVLQQYCDNILELVDSGSDYRIFDLLYQHKKIMTKRVGYLVSSDKTLEQFISPLTEIEKKSLMIRNLFLKFTIVRDVNIVLKLKVYLKELEEREKEVLHNIVT